MNELIIQKDYAGIEKALTENPALANAGIPYDEKNTVTEHPLHRICDRVFSKLITDAEGVTIAKIFLAHGADVNWNNDQEFKDTPLLAAASLHAEQVALLYIDAGADIRHKGCHGGTALHWAAWVGRDQLVARLIKEKAPLNQRCRDFEGTPFLWAVHGYKFANGQRYHQVQCARLLLQAGADKTIPNGEGTLAIEFLDPEDKEMIEAIS